MDESKVQSALLGWIITLAITVSVLLRRDKDVRQKLFILLSGNLTLYYFSSFLYQFLGYPVIERITLIFATLIPIGGIFFFRSFSPGKSRIRLIRLAVALALVLIVLIIHPDTLKPAMGPAIMAYIAGFLLVALLDLNVQARIAPTRVDTARIRYLAFGGFLAVSLQVTDSLDQIFDIYMPPLGLATTLLYLYFISQSIVRYRILDLYEMLGRLAVLTMMGVLLAIIYYALILYVGTGEGFFVNAFLASLVILLLFDPLRDFVEQRITDFFFGERLFLEQKTSQIRFQLAHVFHTDDMVDILMSGLEESKRSTHIALYLLDAHGTGFDLRSFSGPSPQMERIEIATARKYLKVLASGSYLSAANLQVRRAKSLQEGRGETTTDIKESLDLLEKINGDLVMLLEGEDDILGFLCLKDERINDAYTPEEIKALVALAAQAAITVENSHIYQQMKERDRLASLGEMSAGLAHEIRNPLGAIKAAAQFIEEVISEDEEQSEDGEYLAIIVEEVNRLNHVVSDFLSYARPASGEPEKLDVQAVLEKTLQLYEAGKKTDMKITLKIDKDVPGVFINGDRLQQVFLNLILNAEQAMGSQENAALEISIKLRKVRRMQKDGNQANVNFTEIRFADNGPGIEPGILQNIFIPFFTTKSSGAGLGLSVCQRLVRDAGGDIELRSQVGQGSIFSVVLPIARKERKSGTPPSPI
jgi:nitrogen-specific signal transduction histidine kinase